LPGRLRRQRRAAVVVMTLFARFSQYNQRSSNLAPYHETVIRC
jgi:hypothetical protein